LNILLEDKKINFKKSYLLKKNFYKFLYFLLFLIVNNNDFVASFTDKNNSYNLSNKNNYILNNNLLVQGNNIKTIIVNGTGNSKEKAAMNAAQNALLMASPRYVKKRRVDLYKKTVVNNNIVKNDSLDSFRSTSFGFNQGSILSFKLIKSSSNNNLHKVVAIAKIGYGLNEQEYHPLFKPSEVSTKEIGLKKIFKIGTGSSEDDAINDAIKQALLFVVGERIYSDDYLDSVKKLTYFIENEIEKKDLYIKETIGKLTSGYSEGYIESLNILNSFEEDGLFKVEADVVVRIKTFSSYIDEKLDITGIKIKDDK
jgi:hypothetical protein